MITINLDRAKIAAHDYRRAARAAEFAPHDAIIAKRIPGTAEAEAEAQRQVIRERNAAVQEQIDAATDHHELRAIINEIAVFDDEGAG